MSRKRGTDGKDLFSSSCTWTQGRDPILYKLHSDHRKLHGFGGIGDNLVKEHLDREIRCERKDGCGIGIFRHGWFRSFRTCKIQPISPFWISLGHAYLSLKLVLLVPRWSDALNGFEASVRIKRDWIDLHPATCTMWSLLELDHAFRFLKALPESCLVYRNRLCSINGAVWQRNRKTCTDVEKSLLLLSSEMTLGSLP